MPLISILAGVHFGQIPFTYTSNMPESMKRRYVNIAYFETKDIFLRMTTSFQLPPSSLLSHSLLSHPLTLSLSHSLTFSLSHSLTLSLSHFLRIRPSSLNPRLCESAALVVLAPQTRNAIRHSGGRAPVGRLGSVTLGGWATFANVQS